MCPRAIDAMKLEISKRPLEVYYSSIHRIVLFIRSWAEMCDCCFECSIDTSWKNNLKSSSLENMRFTLIWCVERRIWGDQISINRTITVPKKKTIIVMDTCNNIYGFSIFPGQLNVTKLWKRTHFKCLKRDNYFSLMPSTKRYLI